MKSSVLAKVRSKHADIVDQELSNSGLFSGYRHNKLFKNIEYSKNTRAEIDQCIEV